MSKTLRVANGLELPAEIAGRRTAVFGISGSGKSNTATVLVEQLLKAGEQVVLIDPKGEGWGLLSLASGKPSDLPAVVFGEPNGHIENVNETHGPRLADFVVDAGRSVVLSLLGFESDQSERRFVATFLRQLYRRKSRQGRPTRTLVVLDEAHLFIPENARGDGAELSGAVQRIVRQGRSFGIGTLLIDQRPQDVAKRVVTQCDTLVCHQLVHNTDRDALKEWVRGYDTDGRGKTFLDSLASLQPGEAWVWSPAWLKVFERVKVDRRATFDSGAAPDGGAAARTVRRAEVDLEALRGQLAEIVEKAKADDPKELRRRIAELEKQLRDRPAAAAPVEKLVEVPVLKNGQLEKTEEVVRRLEAVASAATAEAGELRRLIAPVAAPRPTPKPATPVAARPAPVKRAASAPETDGGAAPLSKAERLILTALAQHGDCSKSKVAILAGYAVTGGGFNNALGALRSRGYVNTGGEPLRATEEGLAALGRSAPLPTGSALLDHWRGRLGKAEREILDVLAAAHPNALTKEEAAARTVSEYEPTGGGFNNAVGRLRTLELVTGRGELRASDDLFA